MNETSGFYLKRGAGLVIAVLLAWGVTLSGGGHDYPVGWVYIALFVLTGALTFIARGTYMWIAAVWLGAFLVVCFGPRPLPDNLLLGAVIVGLQFLSAVLTGGLLGQWLRYQFAKRRGAPLPRERSRPPLRNGKRTRQRHPAALEQRAGDRPTTEQAV